MSQGWGVLTNFLQHLVVQCIHDQMACTTAMLTKMCYCSQNLGIRISTSLTKGNFSKPILLLFVILCIYNFTSYMSKKYMTDSFLLSNLLAYLAATQYPLSIFSLFFFFFSILHTVATLLVQDFRQQKNQPLPIQRSRPSRDSQEPKTTKKFQFSRWLFQKIPFLYFFLHKSWIQRTLGQVVKNFSCCHFHNASKEYFWSKSCCFMFL